ncbi:hypothetical protein P7C73_g6404, partial [Tremellales sp. Uapishka_1]
MPIDRNANSEPKTARADPPRGRAIRTPADVCLARVLVGIELRETALVVVKTVTSAGTEVCFEPAIELALEAREAGEIVDVVTTVTCAAVEDADDGCADDAREVVKMIPALDEPLSRLE